MNNDNYDNDDKQIMKYKIEMRNNLIKYYWNTNKYKFSNNCQLK